MRRPLRDQARVRGRNEVEQDQQARQGDGPTKVDPPRSQKRLREVTGSKVTQTFLLRGKFELVLWSPSLYYLLAFKKSMACLLIYTACLLLSTRQYFSFLTWLLKFVELSFNKVNNVLQFGHQVRTSAEGCGRENASALADQQPRVPWAPV